jgi:hypothetical protein
VLTDPGPPPPAVQKGVGHDPPHNAAAFSRWLRWPLAGVLAAAGVLLAGLPRPALAATGDFEIQAFLGPDQAA